MPEADFNPDMLARLLAHHAGRVARQAHKDAAELLPTHPDLAARAQELAAAADQVARLAADKPS